MGNIDPVALIAAAYIAVLATGYGLGWLDGRESMRRALRKSKQL